MVDPNIFVSYSRADADLVIRLSTELKETGINLWLDQLDIAAGETWDIEVERALEACECVLFIVSQSSVASNNVLNEVYYALEERKKVVPVKVDDCKIPFRIKRLQYIDLSRNYDEGFKQLMNTLKLRRKPPEVVKDPAQEKESLNATANNIDNEEKIWQQAKNENSITGYEKYLAEFTGGKFRANALSAIDTITTATNKEKIKKEEDLWKEVSGKNTVAAYGYYINNTESGRYKEEANKAISTLENKIEEDSIWEKAKQINSIKSYQDYLKKYASGLYAEMASSTINKLEYSREESLWNEAKLSNTVASIQNYLKNTDLKKHVQEAESVIKEIKKREAEKEEEALWVKAKKENNISAYRNYLRVYKSGKYIDEALSTINALEPGNDPAVAKTEISKTEGPENKNKEKEEEERQLQESLLVDSIEGGGTSIKTSDLLTDPDWIEKNTSPNKKLLIVGGFILTIVIIAIVISLSKNNSLDYYQTETTTSSDSTAMAADTTVDTKNILAADTVLDGVSSKNATDIKITDPGAIYKTAMGLYDKAKYTDAFKWFKKGSEIDSNDYNFLWRLGLMYRMGYGVTKNPGKAVQYFMKAAEMGDYNAMASLGSMYTRGDGLEINSKKAIEWYTKAAEMGYDYAMVSIGNIYRFGDIVKTDSKKAIEWYTKAAEKGEAIAMHSLGEMYKNGEGVSIDIAKSNEWFKKAKLAGY